MYYCVLFNIVFILSNFEIFPFPILIQITVWFSIFCSNWKYYFDDFHLYYCTFLNFLYKLEMVLCGFPFVLLCVFSILFNWAIFPQPRKRPEAIRKNPEACVFQCPAHAWNKPNGPYGKISDAQQSCEPAAALSWR